MRESDEDTITFMIYEQMLVLKRVATELNLSNEDVENILCNNAKNL